VILLLLHVSACGSRACGAAGMRRWADDSKGACFYGSGGAGRFMGCDLRLAGWDGGGLCAFFQRRSLAFLRMASTTSGPMMDFAVAR